MHDDDHHHAASGGRTTLVSNGPFRVEFCGCGTVHINTVVDPRVMGGIKVEIGDEVIDGTIMRKLDGARRAMGA